MAIKKLKVNKFEVNSDELTDKEVKQLVKELAQEAGKLDASGKVKKGKEK